ncbi:hypothetical protein BDA99DRAFT_565780 [Phascolomyces articulosus]|uniref:Uncharacterized protein n=1 Tax=Phascolomyces articulosus TaxID=60185 RepID=A0AAD5JXN4_9FUNG|nr:hypothetical protein BDA99DRAFT_565780 [Phascolomyces articulosus]
MRFSISIIALAILSISSALAVDPVSSKETPEAAVKLHSGGQQKGGQQEGGQQEGGQQEAPTRAGGDNTGVSATAGKLGKAVGDAGQAIADAGQAVDQAV